MGAVSNEDIIRALEDAVASEGPEDAYTAKEIGKLIGLEVQAVRRRLGVLKDAGRLEVVRVPKPNLTGQLQSTWAYRILPG